MGFLLLGFVQCYSFTVVFFPMERVETVNDRYFSVFLQKTGRLLNSKQTNLVDCQLDFVFSCFCFFVSLFLVLLFCCCCCCCFYCFFLLCRIYFSLDHSYLFVSFSAGYLKFDSTVQDPSLFRFAAFILLVQLRTILERAYLNREQNFLSGQL